MSSLFNSTDSLSVPFTETNLTRQIKFVFLLTIQIPSIACYLILLYHLVSRRSMRKILHNHVIIALLIVGLTTVLVDLPMIFNYLRTGLVIPSIPILCLIWNFIDLLLYALISVLMFWASFERHILIFHDQLVNTRQRRRFVHYTPLIVLPFYLIMFYAIITFIHPCQNNFDYTQVVCGGLCYLSNSPWLGVTDQLVHNIIPAICIAFLNLSLLIRVLWQKKHRMHQPIQWRRHCKMIKQLLPVCVLYLCGVIPFGLLACVHLFGGWPETGLDIQQLYFFYLFYLLALFLPFVCLIGMPDMYSKVFCKQRKQVAPNLIQAMTNY